MFVALAIAATPTWAQDGEEATKLGGLRIEAHAGIERPNLNESEDGTDYVAKLGSSFAYGGEIGYDIPVSNTVTVGPYVALDLSSSDICDTGSAGINTNVTVCFKSKSSFSAGLRGAVAVGRKGEVYLTAGYDKYSYDYSEVYRNATTSAVIDTYTNDGDDGFSIGLGYNHDITKNVYLGLGMRVSELGNFEGTDINLQRFQGHVNLGVRF